MNPSNEPSKCPVCNGTGLVSVPPGVAGDAASFTSGSSGPWPCQACDGTGIIGTITEATTMLHRIQTAVKHLQVADQLRDAALRDIDAWLTDMERSKQ